MTNAEQNHTTEYSVDFEPVGRRGTVSDQSTLLDSARQLGVDLLAICGGEGSCGHCKIQVIAGQVSPISASERQLLSDQELNQGYRLACQTYPLSDLKLRVPSESLSTPQRTQVEGLDADVELNPIVRGYQVALTPPSLIDLTADRERITIALAEQHGVDCPVVDFAVLREAPYVLRSHQWEVESIVRGGEMVAIRAPHSRQLGLAFDLGTTKIAGYLLDLTTGETIARQGAMNPQIAYGEDLISRLSRVRGSTSEAAKMQELVVSAFNELAESMCGEVGGHTSDILEAVVVANTAMHHLFLRLPTEQLITAPYPAAVSGALDVKARELGLRIASGGYVHVLPNIAAYVGADHVAMILATRPWKTSGLVLALDIGTNTEICLASNGKMTSVSAASGPAFEGAHIRHGMRAAPGAIEHVIIADNHIQIQTVGGAAAVGLCGSGIVDAVAQAYGAGIIDRTGRMVEHPLVRNTGKDREFVLAKNGSGDIVLSQHDVREVQLAKGAIRAGVSALLQDAGRSEDEIDEIIIAGAFGSYIDPASAIAIGLLPVVPISHIRQVGNAAGTGARIALLSQEERKRAEEVAKRVHYIELASVPGFAKIFAKGISLA